MTLPLLDHRDFENQLAAHRIWQSGPARGGEQLSLLEVQIEGLVMSHEKLFDVQIVRSVLRTCRFYDCDLRGALLVDTSFENCTFERCCFYKADLSGARLTGVTFAECDLSRANLYEADLRGVKIHGGSLAGAWLTRTDLRQAQLAGIDLAGARLIGARLYDADLRDLRGVDQAVVTDLDLSPEGNRSRLVGREFLAAVASR